MSWRVLITRSNPIAPDPRVERIAAVLSESGWSVTILGWDRTGEAAPQEQRGYGSVELLPIRAGFGRGLGNLPQTLRWTWGLFRWLVRKRDSYDVIHACDFDTLLPALWVRWLWGKRVVYDIFDFYADHLRSTPKIVKGTIRALDLWAIAWPEAVILADESRKVQIRGSKPRRLIVVYNSPDDQLDQLQSAGGPASRIPAGDALSLSFVGLLQVERGLMQLLQVLEKRPQWRLELAGFGGDEAQISTTAARLANVRFHGRIPYQRALQLMASTDALIATYDPGIANHRFSSPNKLFEAMMLAKPIIVARGTNMDRIVDEHGCGIVVPYGDLEALEAALSKLAAEPKVRHRMGAAGRRSYESTYSWHTMSQRIVDLYRELQA